MHNGFSAELARFGPDSNFVPVSLAWARSYCARLARSHYENFSVVSLLLPRPLIPHFQAVYAYCRWADDLGDETGGGAQALKLLRWWREELLTCYSGKPRHPVMIALRETIREFAIPPKPFLDLLFAFEQDQLVKRYASYEQLLGYCRNSANPVGHLVLYLGKAYDERLAAMADHICTALQLANFWQDVARDYDIGRVYLPDEDRIRFGYGDVDLEKRLYTPQFRALMQFEVERTRDMFKQGLPLVDMMPRSLRVDIDLFIRGGLAILNAIERIDYNVWRERPTVGKWTKVGLMAKAMSWRLLHGIVHV